MYDIQVGGREGSFLRSLFKCITIDGKSTEHPQNFPKEAGVIALIRNMGGKVWEYPAEAKRAFPNIRMVILVTRTKKMSNFSLGGSWFCSTHLHIGL